MTHDVTLRWRRGATVAGLVSVVSESWSLGDDSLRAAAVCWQELRPEALAFVFNTLAGLGFNAVELAVPWAIHARDAETVCFEGALDPTVVIERARSAGLWVIVRVGAVGALPRWISRDGAMASLTRRRTPRLSIDHEAVIAVPSLSSREYQTACETFIRRVCESLGLSLRLVDRWIVDAGPAALARGGPWDSDNHPDAPAVDADPAERALREASVLASHLGALARVLVEHGVARAHVAVQVPGRASQCTALEALARAHPVVVSLPRATAGTRAIWREARLCAGCRSPVGALGVLFAGHRALAMPSRDNHTLSAARLALAAGVRDFTVQFAFGGEGFIGGFLDREGVPLATAARWSELLAWGRSLPDGTSLGEQHSVRAADVARAHASAVAVPVVASLLSTVGFDLGELSPTPTADTVTVWVAEKTLQGVSWGLCAGREAVGEATRAVKVEPEGAAFLRAVRGVDTTHWVCAAADGRPVTVTVGGEHSAHLQPGDVVVIAERG